METPSIFHQLGELPEAGYPTAQELKIADQAADQRGLTTLHNRLLHGWADRFQELNPLQDDPRVGLGLMATARAWLHLVSTVGPSNEALEALAMAFLDDETAAAGIVDQAKRFGLLPAGTTVH